MSINKQLLDPLGTICKLVGLNFSSINTKITIHNHIVTLQEPSNYQFITRSLFGDSKENISDMFYVMVRVIKWYLIDDNNNDNNNENYIQIANSPELKKIIKYACDALKKLQSTYQYGNVILAIQFYINILEDALNDRYNETKLPKYIIEKEAYYENLLDYKKIRNFWDYKKLKRVCELYDQCFRIYKDMEIIESEKDIMFAGYLKSVNAILELSDKEFQTLMQNSANG